MRSSTALALLRGCPYYDDDARPGTFIYLSVLHIIFSDLLCEIAALGALRTLEHCPTLRLRRQDKK